MKIELKSKQDSVYKKLCSSASETHSDSELIVPDTLEDILRILCCRWQCRIREKTVSQDAVLVSGEIDITVMYIPETGDGVRVVGTTAAFELSFDAPGADSTSLAVTKLDVLEEYDKIPVCVAYEIDGERTDEFPTGERLNKAKPVYEYMEGFGKISHCRKLEELPKAARAYIDYMEQAVNCKIQYISVGADRDAYIEK